MDESGVIQPVVIYGDTDSVMVCAKDVKSIEECFTMGDLLADHITDEVFRDHAEIVLENEKVTTSYTLFKKKRYLGLAYPYPGADPKLDYKGIEIKRRDGSPLLRSVYRRIVDEAIISRNMRSRMQIKNDVKRVIEEELLKLEKNKYPHDQYIFSKSMRASYKNRNLPHVQVVDKIAARVKTGTYVRDVPVAGDRVTYVVLHKKGKVSERAEDSQYFADHLKANLRLLDRSWYCDNMFNALQQLTSMFLSRGWLRKRMDQCSEELKRQQSGHPKITSFFQKRTRHT